MIRVPIRGYRRLYPVLERYADIKCTLTFGGLRWCLKPFGVVFESLSANFALHQAVKDLASH